MSLKRSLSSILPTAIATFLLIACDAQTATNNPTQDSTPIAPAGISTPTPTPVDNTAEVQATAEKASPSTEDIKRHQRDEAEMADKAEWIDYKDPKGNALRVKFYEKNQPGFPDPLSQADLQMGDDKVILLTKITQDKGDPVYGDGGNPGITLISREGGGQLELVEGDKKTIYSQP